MSPMIMLIICSQILRNLRYVNRYPDNRVTDGLRMLSIVTTDTNGAESGYISAEITVMDLADREPSS